MTAALAAVPDLVEEVRHRLVGRGGALTPHAVADALRSAGHPVGDATVLAVHETLRRDLTGAGPLEPLLRLEGVTDVLVDGPGRVLLDRGAGLEPAEVGGSLATEDAVRRLAQRLAATAGRRLDDASPCVDARLRDGTRLHAVLAPVARPGTLISLRVPRRRAFSVEGLVAAGSLDHEGGRLLRRIVDARLAFLVTGGTGSGKTTVLEAMLSSVAPAERVVVVEDSAELRPGHPRVVGLEGRPANLEGAGEVSLRTLVRQALRMRPDRLVVGEVRGGEVVDLLAALNTGHEGGCGTLHANRPADVPARVEALALAAGMAREAVHSQLASALQAVVHLARGRDGARRVHEVAVLRRDGPWVQAVPAVHFGTDGRGTPGPAERQLGQLLGPAGEGPHDGWEAR